MFEALRRDAASYAASGGWWKNLGFWVGATYRFGAWARQRSSPLLRFPLLVLAWVIKQPVRLLLHVEMPNRTRIGPGLHMPHPYGVILGPGVEIGQDCVLFHDVTLGYGPSPGLPRLGDNVVCFAGSRLLGGVTVGDKTEIGANCVVLRSVPAASVVAPAIAKVIPQSLFRRPAPAEAAQSETASAAPAPVAPDTPGG